MHMKHQQCVKLKGKTFNLQLGMWNNMWKKNVDFHLWNYHVKKKKTFSLHVWKFIQFGLYKKKYVKLNISLKGPIKTCETSMWNILSCC